MDAVAAVFLYFVRALENFQPFGFGDAALFGPVVGVVAFVSESAHIVEVFGYEGGGRVILFLVQWFPECWQRYGRR